MFLIILGPPGAGKGTVAGIIIEKVGITRISTGDILRSAIKQGTELGLKAKEYMDAGDLVPDPLILDMVEDFLTPAILEQGFIMDGFPRTIAQAESFDDLLAKKNIALDLVILIDVEREELIRRMLNRRTCSNPECQAVYSISYSPPKVTGICDSCGSELITRSDQREDVISNRLQVYERKTRPLISFYEDKGILKRYSHDDSEVIAERILKDVSH